MADSSDIFVLLPPVAVTTTKTTKNKMPQSNRHRRCPPPRNELLARKKTPVGRVRSTTRPSLVSARVYHLFDARCVYETKRHLPNHYQLGLQLGLDCRGRGKGSLIRLEHSNVNHSVEEVVIMYQVIITHCLSLPRSSFFFFQSGVKLAQRRA